MHEQPPAVGAIKSLEVMFNRFSDEDKIIIQEAIFNDTRNVPIENAMENIRDDETARTIMREFRSYIEMKKQSATREKLKTKAAEIMEYVCRAATPQE